VDSALGAVFGVVMTLISYWLIGSLLLQGPSQSLAHELRRSNVLAKLDELAKPPNVLATLGQYLNTSGFPQVFAPGFSPPVGPPVKLPSVKKFKRTYKDADQSTVRIIVSGCGGLQLGSAWVASRTAVVTNAHVVAGGRHVVVQDTFGNHRGVVVLFDPRTDLAVVHVARLRDPRLRLVKRVVKRGTQGVTLGYPGSRRGALVAFKAAVQGSFKAQGRDIYGRSFVRRDIYQLRANVRQGDSGGPFVLPGGRVAGVVFAASLTQANTGYALTGRQVAKDVARGVRARRAVSTGPCTH
jgi:S1-C subfamily serine protease